MKKLHLILIFLLLPICLVAQKDSLRNIATDSLKKLATTHRYENPLKAKAYALLYYKRALAAENAKTIADACYTNAMIYNSLAQKDSAHYFIDKSIAISNGADTQEQYINSLYFKGTIYYDSDIYDKAIEIFTKVYRLVEKENDIPKLADIRHSIALVKNQIGQPKQAVALAKKNLDLYATGVLNKNEKPIDYLNLLLSLSNTYTNLADNFHDYKEQYLDSAEIYNAEGLSKSLKVKDLEGHSIFLTLEGIIYQKRKELKKALNSFKIAEKQIKKLGFHNQLSVLYLYEGKNFFLQNDIDKAIEYLSKVESIAKSENANLPSIQETYILLANCYAKKNDKEKALAYFKLFEEKDQQNDVLARIVSENIYKEYDVPSFKKKIEQLQNVSEKEQLKSKSLLYLCSLLVVILVFGFWYYKRRERIHKIRFNNILDELKELELSKKEEEKKEPQAYKVNDENVRKILEGLKKFEQKEMFLQKKCTLNYVAKKINTNSTYLSKTLQSHKQKKFVQYITDLRLNYALTRLKNDSKFRTYDIKSIASELGFNTAESFSKAFKKKTGIYPSFYIKNLNSLEKN